MRRRACAQPGRRGRAPVGSRGKADGDEIVVFDTRCILPQFVVEVSDRRQIGSKGKPNARVLLVNRRDSPASSELKSAGTSLSLAVPSPTAAACMSVTLRGARDVRHKRATCLSLRLQKDTRPKAQRVLQRDALFHLNSNSIARALQDVTMRCSSA